MESYMRKEESLISFHLWSKPLVTQNKAFLLLNLYLDILLKYPPRILKVHLNPLSVDGKIYPLGILM